MIYGVKYIIEINMDVWWVLPNVVVYEKSYL